MGEGPVKRRDVHEHPDADEDEVNDYLQATIARLDAPRARGVRPVPHFQLRTSIFLTASFHSRPLSF